MTEKHNEIEAHKKEELALHEAHKKEELALHEAHQKEAHKAKKDSIKIDVNPWMIATILLAVIMVAGLVFIFLNASKNPVVANNTANANNLVTNGKTVLIEAYSDYQCPYCKRYAEEVESKLRQEYGNKLDIKFIDFPLDSIHPNARISAIAAECAGLQGKELEYGTVLFAKQSEWAPLSDASTKLKEYAKSLNLDSTKFDSCITNKETASVVEADYQKGIKVGIQGTPTVYVNGVQAKTDYALLKTAIDKAFGLIPTTPDPVLNLTVINPPSKCTTCEPADALIVNMKKSFPTIKETIISYSSAEGKALADKMQVTALPAYVFDSKVVETNAYKEDSRLSQIFAKNGDNYLVNPLASGSNYLLKGPEVGTAVIEGDAKAKLTIIEYSDFQCPFCRSFYTDTYKQIKKDYIDNGKVKLAFKHYPLDFHPMAMTYAMSVECARDQNKFWEMHDKIFDEQAKKGQNTVTDFNVDSVKGWAIDLKLDANKFDVCLDSNAKQDIVLADQAEGLAFGVSGTPAFFIGNEILAGAYPYEAAQGLPFGFKDLIEQKLAEAK